MPQISLLDKSVYELIAAGEVIEKPASVIKEVVENSIDAGAKHITVEIKHGGIEFMRVADDGCGIAYEDVSKAFLRHATSKISEKSDLDKIFTLGFRGEALASVAAVSKVTVLTKQKEDELGTCYKISASVEESIEKTGCPDGTTIIIKDLFYNVPARKKFLKKEVTEANAISFIIRKVALSHPEISFKFIRDNKMEFCSSGNGDLKSAIYSVYGKDFSNDMVPVEYEEDDIKIIGYTVKPLYSKNNRAFQNFFVDNRYVSSKICSNALENAYENLIMTGKFPACVINISMPPAMLDVNIHPTKAQVRFQDEKKVSDAVYFAIKNALMKANFIYDFQLPSAVPSRQWKDNNVGKNTDFTTIPLENTEKEEEILNIKSENEVKSVVLTRAEKADEIIEKMKKNDENDEKEDIILDTSESGENIEKTSENCDFLMEKVIQSKIIKTDTLSDNESESENNSEYGINDIENKNIEDISKNGESLMEKVIQSKIIKNDNLSDNESKQENNYIYNAESGKIENVPENSESLMEKVIQSKIIKDESFPVENVENTENPEEKQESDTADSEKKEKNITVIGEAFKNYIIAQADENIIIIDKHAAHERVLFEKLKRGVGKLDQQYLMIPSKMLFSNAEYEALQSNAEKLADLGFIFEFDEFPYATLKAVPMFLSELDADEIVTEIAHNLMSNKQNPQTHYFDDMLHTMACKAAIKANDDNLTEELQYLADEIFDDNSIRHCPHGRPVMFKISKYELEKQFKRIV